MGELIPTSKKTEERKKRFIENLFNPEKILEIRKSPRYRLICKSNNALRGKSEPVESLIVRLEGVIGEAFTYYEENSSSFTPRSERVIGGRSPVYDTGENSRTRSTFTFESPVQGVSRISIHGQPLIMAGDIMRAYVFAAKKQNYEKFAEGYKDFLSNAIFKIPFSLEEEIEVRNGKTITGFPVYALLQRKLSAHENAFMIEKITKRYRTNRFLSLPDTEDFPELNKWVERKYMDK